MILLRDERWPVARLIPITSSTGVGAKERNTASALLAVVAHADAFGRTLLKPLGGIDKQFGSDARVHRIAEELRVEHTIQDGHDVMDR